MNVLVINGHPDLSQSVANATILADLTAQTDWTIHSVAGFAGDIHAEQQRLLEADVVVVQFPLYWSTYPAVLKKWVDDVFTYGFAFGPEGSQLKDKPFLFSVTAGATAESYSTSGFNFLPFSHYQVAYEHPFRAAEVNVLDTHITFEMNATPEEGGDKDNTLALAHTHASRLIDAVNAYLETRA
ncbi:NAD(P)H-dependent oxidoreductase [Photobacterium aphoticum]|uniref:NAD(P)H dehydrogenase n=1 Tax=Photobacterium aphoticum TaxID=754436 RepID=A0A0J1GLW3_9GAMM|nr:NAD(P)H-dependent oxidoreductase [Photobacterium aphoticum]KLV00710.1 NAD(P)H dehydrogenase [Photobacterium aphoticum]PSU58302.1 NAD(P)H dehydrogenase [Photobacterium aphoticum]GHA50613.1 NAD(P)H dehydrogenase (quinone) [Photobacterium aphoticum]